jgi:ParB-like chromosome segregation protein Spo0J
MRLIEVSLKDIKPNPFRDISTYPFDEEKISRLMESIGSTGFWPSVIVRMVGDVYECAFGHHRIEAGKRAGVKIAPVVLQKLGDDEMLKMMVDENAIEYGHDFLSTLNSVSAVVKAYGDGAIELNPVAEEAKGRCAFVNDKPYNTLTVATYLGWTTNGKPADRVNVAVNALQLIEKGICKVEQFRGLNKRASMALVRDAMVALKYEEKKQKQIEDERERRKAALEAQKKISRDIREKSEGLRKGDVSPREIFQDVKEKRAKAKQQTFVAKEKKEGKDISKLVASATTRVRKLVDVLDNNKEQLRFLYKLISMSENTVPATDLRDFRAAFASLCGEADKHGTWLHSAIEERRKG